MAIDTRTGSKLSPTKISKKIDAYIAQMNVLIEYANNIGISEKVVFEFESVIGCLIIIGCNVNSITVDECTEHKNTIEQISDSFYAFDFNRVAEEIEEIVDFLSDVIYWISCERDIK